MTISDLRIPRLTDIVSRAQDIRDSAVRLGDELLIKRIDTLVRDKLPHARLCWQLGTLHIDSPSGQRYQVTRAGCDCLNGQRSSKRQCWHLLIHELLLDIFQTDCDTADMQAEPRAVAPRIVACRSLVWANLN